MSLKSLARDWRRETRWTALMSATALKDVIIVMSKKAGRRAQNFRPGDQIQARSGVLGDTDPGRLLHQMGVVKAEWQGNNAATTIPTIGDQSCRLRGARRRSNVTTARVMLAVSGAAIGDTGLAIGCDSQYSEHR